MSAPSRSSDDGHDGLPEALKTGDEPPTRTGNQGSLLAAVVVRTDSGPDRRTIYPRGLTDEERLTTWLSANERAFVELDEWR